MESLVFFLFGASICILIYAFLKAVSLNRRIPGGIVKKTWQLMYYLIGLLVAGYLATLLFPSLPDTSRQIIVGIILLAGAVFIVKVINLLYRIIVDLGL
ncbi:MAG: hypothetical protein P8013_01695 [Candidatus Sulfobium sp.]|jgi:hypothetical protein